MPFFICAVGYKQIVKLCKICNQQKPRSAFYNKKSGLDGLQSRCIDCITLYLENRNYKPTYDGLLLDCSTCRSSKDKTEFYPDKRQKNGLRPECKRCNRNAVLKRKFGISINVYDEMLIKQNNSCAVCLRTEPSGTGSFHVDHNHTTGIIRGLLCSNCNTAIGLLNEDEGILLKVIEYLKGYKLHASFP